MTPAETFAQSRADAEDVIRRYRRAHLHEGLIERLLPALALDTERADDADIPIGASKFGGAPDVPANFDWPMTKRTRLDPEDVAPSPLEFLAQISLREMAPFDIDGVLPHSGILLFFMNWGGDQWHVRHAQEPLTRAQKPALQYEYGLIPSRILPQNVWSIPLFPYWSHNPGDADICCWNDDYGNMAYALNPSECVHYVLGNPFQWMADKAKEARESVVVNTSRGQPEDWITLLHITSDDELGIDFDQQAFAAFFIHRDDLAARDFSRCHLVYERQF